MDSVAAAESSKRRTPRAATKKRKPDTNPSDGSDPKRARTARKNGRLQCLLEISLDIVFEIFGNLQPLDVLRLARTSKEFRALLMHRSSISIWKSSLNNVPGLPPCPPGMTEPQWVSLVFDPTCQVCQKGARKVDWGLFIRICGKCAKTQVSRGLRGFTRLTASEAVHFEELVPNRPESPTRRYITVHFSKELERIKSIYIGMKDFQEQTKFVEERTELVKALREHTKLCEAWSEGNAANRSTELADLKEERFNAIIAKLTDLGWGEELSRILPMDSLRSHKLVKQPQALTERTWNSIKPDMIRYMEEMQTKRFAREHAALLAARKVTATKVLRTFKHSQLPWTDVMPNATSFYDFPAIKAILQAAPEVNVDEWTFESILPDFPEMIATWRAGLLRKLLLLRKNGGLENSDVEDAGSTARLKLATSVYRCLSCDDDDLKASLRRGLRQFELPCRPLYYPRVLSHPCLTLPPDYGQRLLFKENFRDTAWRSHVLAVDKHTAGIVEKVVTACGLDPAKTTAEDMDAADARLACLACAKRGPPELSLGTDPAGKNDATYRTGEKVQAMVQAYSWRNAVRHDGDIHAMWDDGEIQRQPTAWYMLNEADAAIARALEVVAMRKGSEGTETFAGTMQQSAPDSDDAMQDGEDDVAVFLDNSEDEYSVQDGENMETATDCRVRILPSSLPEIAWSCVRCLDRPQEKAPLTFTTVPLDRLQDAAPMTLTATRQHLAARHDVLLAVRDVDYYRVPAAPEVYGPVHFPAPTLTVLGPAIGDEAPVAQ